MQNKTLQTIIFIIVLHSLMFYQIFLLLQVKRRVIIAYKRGIYEVCHEFSNDLRKYFRKY